MSAVGLSRASSNGTACTADRYDLNHRSNSDLLVGCDKLASIHSREKTRGERGSQGVAARATEKQGKPHWVCLRLQYHRPRWKQHSDELLTPYGDSISCPLVPPQLDSPNQATVRVAAFLC